MSTLADLPPGWAWYEVLFPHVREYNGKTWMLEPMFSGSVALPEDEDTKLAIEQGWLKRIQPVQSTGQINQNQKA
jgi:hypothetical protein